MHKRILEMIGEVVEMMVDDFWVFKDPDDADVDGLNAELEKRLLEPETNFVTLDMVKRNSKHELIGLITDRIIERYEAKIVEDEKLGVKFDEVERTLMLRIMDRKWIDHIDDMDNLRIGIGLRGYANQNPITMYQQEGFDMFEEMVNNIKVDVTKILMHIRQKANNQRQETVKITGAALEAIHSVDGGSKIGSDVDRTVRNEGPKVGRNDPCPCGSGKKYKNCCGK